MLKQLSIVDQLFEQRMAQRPDRLNERTRLQEVAIKAGVSASTVSLVLAGKGVSRRISEETQTRVTRIAEELNYAPNLLTRSLRRGRTHVISLFSTFRRREEGDLYMTRLSNAIEVAGGNEGYDVLVHCNFKRTPREIYQFLNGGLSDGLLLFAPRPDDPLLALLHRSSLPVVIINGPDPAGVFSSISDDQEAGVVMVADNLVKYGHRRIALIGANNDQARDADYRISLLRSLLSERGVTVPDELAFESADDPEPLLRSLMSSANPPTAIFCWHDRLAYKVLAACERLGIQVPDQLSVVGYDGLQWPSATRHIAASIHVDISQLAARAVRMLDQAITQGSEVVRQEILPVTFHPGTSLGPVPTMQRSNV